MAWNRSAPNIDNVNKTTKKRLLWRWLVLGAFTVAVAMVIVQSFQSKKIVALNPKDVKWTYQVVDGGIILGAKDGTAVPKETSGALIIPEIIDGKPVRSIAQRAFSSCSNLVAVTIPSSVVEIGYAAFSDCCGLTSFSVDSCNPSYSSIGGLLCSKDELTLIAGVNGEVAIPPSVTRIEAEAFRGCGGLTSVKIPERAENVGDWSFCDCCALKSVTIPSSVTNIGIQAFRDCGKLTSAKIPDSVESIGNLAFKGTPFYNNMSEGMVILGGGVLYAYKGNCPPELTIPDNVKRIGCGVFKGCGGLRSVTISEGVMEIGTRAFKDCVGLKSVAIPSSEFTVGCERIGYEAFAGCSGLTSLVLPEGVVSIGQRAFKECVGIKSLTIPSSVTSIGSGAFSGCRGLLSVTLPASLKALDSTWAGRSRCERQFQDCRGVSVTIEPDRTRSVGECLLQNSGWFNSVTITEGVTNIGHHAFYGCREITSVTIPSSVVSIGHNAFSGCSKLTSVVIPEGVISIGGGAFSDCDGLTSVTIPPSVTNIDGFARCRALTSVIIPGVASIGDCAFMDCSRLTSIMISESVTNVSPRAFVGCTNLKTVDIVKDGRVETVSVEEFCKRWKLQLNPFRALGVRPAFGGGSLRVRRLQLQKEAAGAKENTKPVPQPEAGAEKARRKAERVE